MLSAALATTALEIAILTMTPGSDLFARFGHTAVRVMDESHVRVYNYGTFNGADPQIARKFLDNRVDYWLSAGSWKPFLDRYADRDIVVQTLSLTEEEARRAASYLEWNVRPENRAYRYDWFRNNCSTKVRDLVDYATGGDVRKVLGARPAERTLRGVLEKVLAPLPSVFFMMDIGLNRRLDAPQSRFEELAMPEDLMIALREVTRTSGVALVSQEAKIVGPAPRPSAEPVSMAHVVLSIIVALLSLGPWRPRVGAVGIVAWSALSGLIGMWCLVWTPLPYPDTHFSANIIAWNPAMWIVLPTAIALAQGRVKKLWRARATLIVVMGLTVLEQLVHVLGFGSQRHFHFTAYALVCDALVLWTLREGERVFGGGHEATTERASEVRDEMGANLVDGDGATRQARD